MTVLVTGAAGFVGSTLVELLLDEGHTAVGVDAFTDYYPRELKERNLSRLRGRTGFRFVEADLSRVTVAPLLTGVDTVFHLAGQPGVRASWGADFTHYVRNNVLVTQLLLEACRGPDAAQVRLRVELLGVRGRRGVPDRRDPAPKPRSRRTA